MKTKKLHGKQAEKNRKQLRKEQRKQKKLRRHEYYTNRKKPGTYVLNPNNSTKQLQIDNNKRKMSTLPSEDVRLKRMLKEKQQQKLLKQMQKQRNKQLKEANYDEDRNIKKLEKQLKLNKRKNKSVPKSFASDGLDYLLEICDAETMKSAAAAEQQFTETNDDFIEDFALMTGTTLGDDAEDVSENESMSDTGSVEDINPESADDVSENESMSDAESLEDINPEDSDAKSLSIEEDYSDSQNDNKKRGSLQQNNIKQKQIKTVEGSDDSQSEDEEFSKNEGTWEDIYGRLRSEDGSVINQNKEGKYVPPAIKNKLELNSNEDNKRAEKLKKQLKGLLNRLAEANMHSISTQIEELYMKNSRNDMNTTLINLIFESLVSSVLMPERLLLEHVMLITILHANIGTEVGAHFLQMLVKKFEELFHMEMLTENKQLDNVASIIAQLYNFKVFHSQLLYQILKKLSNSFKERDIGCILLILKSVGFSLRKDDPLALKDLILEIQKQAASASDVARDNAHVKYMLDILIAIKNNNMSKIPNYDTTYSEHLKKLLKSFIRKGNYVTQLNISLDDLLKADEQGKWWIVGSAWAGNLNETKNDEEKLISESYSSKLLKLAKKQHMNTESRKNIFCIIMSAEDYLEAFEKLLRLGLKNQQEREIIHIILHCCLREKKFNPYYAILAQKFCDYDRKYQMTIKYSIWDKLKTLTECSATQMSNLAKLLIHLFLEKGLPISVLKIMQFSELDKITLRFMRQVLLGILLHNDLETVQSVFFKIAQSEKLKMYRESLRLFIHHFLLKNLNSGVIPDNQKNLLEERAKIVEKILIAKEGRTKL